MWLHPEAPGAPLRRDNFSAPSPSLQTVQFYPWQTLHLWWMSQCTRNFEIYGLLIGNRTAKELEGMPTVGGAGLFLHACSLVAAELPAGRHGVRWPDALPGGSNTHNTLFPIRNTAAIQRSGKTIR
jgi:hypothetical protein